MIEWFAFTISVLALGVSFLVAWLTLLKKGTVRMTRPTIVILCPNVENVTGSGLIQPKVFLRTLLFATSKSGRIVEHMYVRLSKGNAFDDFSYWAYVADSSESLVRGSGVFVGESGVEANHHFLRERSKEMFYFSEGRYALEVHASLLGDTAPKCLYSLDIEIPHEIASRLNVWTAVHFNWDPQRGEYCPRLEQSTDLLPPKLP